MITQISIGIGTVLAFYLLNKKMNFIRFEVDKDPEYLNMDQFHTHVADKKDPYYESILDSQNEFEGNKSDS